MEASTRSCFCLPLLLSHLFVVWESLLLKVLVTFVLVKSPNMPGDLLFC